MNDAGSAPNYTTLLDVIESNSGVDRAVNRCRTEVFSAASGGRTRANPRGS
jgi:hypothetical protein